MNILSSRIAISSLFFLHGLCFGSWGSRIPAIQEFHHLSESELGTLLLSIPIGQILSMPLAAGMVARFGSRNILIIAACFYGMILTTLGLAPDILSIVICLSCFGLASNLVNISLNTQAVDLEAIYNKPIMASFHGLWSTAGFVAAAIGAVMIGNGVVPYKHFILISIIALCTLVFSSRYLIRETKKSQAPGKKSFSLPDRSIMGLGLIAFLSMVCEGAMFDWSGIYFKKVVEAEGAWVGTGYVAFMTTMAGTRFFADRFKEKYGILTIIRVSGLLIFLGLMTSVLFPHLITAIIGFLMVGSGVSALVPLVFSEAGRSKSVSPSSAIASVSTIGFLGFLIAPPVIGWIAGMSSLKTSFTLVAFIGLSIALLAKKLSRA